MKSNTNYCEARMTKGIIFKAANDFTMDLTTIFKQNQFPWNGIRQTGIVFIKLVFINLIKTIIKQGQQQQQ